MNARILPVVKDRIRQYRDEHHGESPLFVVLPPEEADHLLEEVKKEKGYDDSMVVTEYDGAKIVGHMNLLKGDIRLTNELPDTGS